MHVVFVEKYFSSCPVVILAIIDSAFSMQWLKFSGLADHWYLEFRFGVYLYV